MFRVLYSVLCGVQCGPATVQCVMRHASCGVPCSAVCGVLCRAMCGVLCRAVCCAVCCAVQCGSGTVQSGVDSGAAGICADTARPTLAESSRTILVIRSSFKPKFAPLLARQSSDGKLQSRCRDCRYRRVHADRLTVCILMTLCALSAPTPSAAVTPTHPAAV